MIFFGNPLYRLVSGIVTIVILVVVYFTIIKPTEHTVSNAISQGFKTFHVGTNATGAATSPADKLAKCLAHAHGNVHRVSRCESKFQP